MVTKAVYRGVLELLKYLLVHIEADISRSLESPIFSVFLLFRLALCLCMDVKNRNPSLHAGSASRSRSPFSPRTPSPDFSSGQWGGIINLFTDSASSSSTKSTSKMQDRGEEMRESKSTAVASKPEEMDNIKETNFGGGRNEMSVSQEPSSKHTEGVSESHITQAIVGTDVDSPRVTTEKSNIKPRDTAVSDEKPTPTSTAQTTPTGKTMKRVRTLTDIEVGVPNEAALDLVYLHTELFRGLGNNVKDMICRKSFWAALFVSVVTADRRHLGWNENTVELYQRSVVGKSFVFLRTTVVGFWVLFSVIRPGHFCPVLSSSVFQPFLPG